MKRLLILGIVGALGVAAGRGAEENFSSAVRPGDFSAAGLQKLSPEELARLDALVRDYKSGALVAAKREAAVAEEARVAAEAKTVKAEAARNEAEAQSRVAAQRAEAASAAQASVAPKNSDESFLNKARVLLTPGTEVVFADTDSRIAGNFTGWQGKSILTLENGQRWIVVNGGSYSTPPIASPKVKIVPAQFGAFWMTVEGVKQRVRVSPLGGGN